MNTSPYYNTALFLIEQSHLYHLLSEYVIVNLQIMISMHAVAGDIPYKAMVAVGDCERTEEGQKVRRLC